MKKTGITLIVLGAIIAVVFFLCADSIVLPLIISGLGVLCLFTEEDIMEGFEDENY